MKTKHRILMTGLLTVLLAVFLPVSVMAANGWTLTAYPIRVLIDGEVFQPKDVNGNDVRLFTVDGTTYCPLRALAEAYGLEVGYDAASGTATVSTKGSTVVRAPDLTARDWSYQWRVEKAAESGGETVYSAVYAGTLDETEFQTWWKSFSEDEIRYHAEHLAAEVQSMNPGDASVMQFCYGSYQLGSVYTADGTQRSGFEAAAIWMN